MNSSLLWLIYIAGSGFHSLFWFGPQTNYFIVICGTYHTALSWIQIPILPASPPPPPPPDTPSLGTPHAHPPVDRMAHTCENITFPILRMRSVIKQDVFC